MLHCRSVHEVGRQSKNSSAQVRSFECLVQKLSLSLDLTCSESSLTHSNWCTQVFLSRSFPSTSTSEQNFEVVEVANLLMSRVE